MSGVRAIQRFAALLGLWTFTGCIHVLSYTPKDVPREPARTAYRLAVARLVDARAPQMDEASGAEGTTWRRISDAKLAFVGSNFADALVKRLSASGYFTAVVREAPFVKAHFLLTGKLERFRADVDARDLAAAREREKAAEKLGRTPDDAALRVRANVAVTLFLWRVDRRGQVAVLHTTQISTQKRVGQATLTAATDAVFADVVEQAAQDLLSTMRNARSVSGEAPQGATRLREKDAAGREHTVTSTWIEDQPRWTDLVAPAQKRWPLPPHTDPPVEIGPLP